MTEEIKTNGTHLEMKPTEMFPVDPDVEEKLPFGFETFREPENRVPSWMYRRTTELTPGETIKLFTPAPQDALKAIYKECDEMEGKAFVRLLGMIIPQLRMRERGRIGRVRRTAMKLAEKYLDMIPRVPAEHAVRQAKAEIDMLVARGKEDMRVEMCRHFRNLAKKVEKSIVPGVKAPVREGQDRNGQRMLAVWTKEGEPTEEPQF
jgi:hypothetical protein